MNVKLKDIKTIYINPNETDKYITRKFHTENILSNILNIKNFHHCKSSISSNHCNELKIVTANILENNFDDEPLLILEDDINITHWYLENKDIEIHIPENTDALYLGNYRYGVNDEVDGTYFETPTQDYEGSSELCRVFNMLGGHAIIYKSKKYKEEIIRLFRDEKNHNNNDVILARNMKRFNVYAYKHPIFFQDQRFSSYDLQWCTYVEL